MSARRRLARSVDAGRLTIGVGDLTSIDAPDDSFDAVFDFGVIHHVPNWRQAVVEVARVLRPHGQLVFLEHVRSLGPRGWVQDRVEPLWRHLGAGCRPN